jgi:hypothetical protein
MLSLSDYANGVCRWRRKVVVDHQGDKKEGRSGESDRRKGEGEGRHV